MSILSKSLSLVLLVLVIVSIIMGIKSLVLKIFTKPKTTGDNNDGNGDDGGGDDDDHIDNSYPKTCTASDKEGAISCKKWKDGCIHLHDKLSNSDLGTITHNTAAAADTMYNALVVPFSVIKNWVEGNKKRINVKSDPLNIKQVPCCKKCGIIFTDDGSIRITNPNLK